MSPSYRINPTLGGYYECPKDGTGKRLGPLVGYTGRYEGGFQYVGDVYANFAVLERKPQILHHFATELSWTFDLRRVIQGNQAGRLVFCGVPEGGKTLAALLAFITVRTYVYPEKQVFALKTETSREKSRFVWGRHEISQGDRVVIVEDVMNNFSTTDEFIRLIEASGCTVLAITGLLNRSTTIGSDFVPRGNDGHAPVRVVPLLHREIPEYRQDDPEVAEDVRTGNVVWKPKAEWPRLMAAMEAAKR